MAEHTITPAVIEDISVIVQLVNSAYRGESSKTGWTTEAELLDGVRTDAASITEMIHDPNAVILNYVEDGLFRGCVYLKKEADKLYLGMLTVLPKFQTKGIGKHLMEAAEHYANTHQCKMIEITVISVRQELINWYERRGFIKTGESKPFPNETKFGIPKQPLEFIVMQKQIQ